MCIRDSSYNVALRAVNSAGNSYRSNVVVATYVSTPGAPRIESAIVTGSSVAVTFTAPASNGGAAISRYQYSLNNGVKWTAVPSGGAGSFTLSNTARGSYQLVLRAVNEVGSGTISNRLVVKVN